MLAVSTARTRLLELRDRLRGRLAGGAPPAGAGDYAEQATASVAREAEAFDKDAVRGRLRSIDTALQRIDRGEYGDCLACGEPIPPRRLEAVPEAAMDVACAEIAERRLRTITRAMESGDGEDVC